MMVDCPAPEFWMQLLHEGPSSIDHAVLEEHLGGCDSCLKTLADLSGEGSVAGLGSPDQAPPLGPDTFAALARVASAFRVPDERDSAIIGQIAPPAIPGLVDLDVVGMGGMGVVFRAREVDLDRPVAVKVLSSAGRLAPSSRARAIREALLMASLRHPNVVPVYRSGEVEGIPYLVMEWVEGGTLQSRIDAHPLAFREAAGVIRDLAGAVAEAHALGIVHRDLKPENVLLAPAGGPGSKYTPKLADFGLARRGNGDGVTEAGIVLGTPGYMAPEQTGLGRATGDVGPAADIHGLGAILYACLTGRAPYQGRSSWEMLIRAARGTSSPIRRLRRDVPRDLETIVEKCLHATPSRRYRSAGELADDLGRFLECRPISARSTSVPERWLKWARRHPTTAALAALLIASTIGGIAGVAYHIASISATNRNLTKEQGKANAARDRAQQALTSLSDDFLQGIVARGSALKEADRLFLVKIRDIYLKWPAEPDPEVALKLRGEGLVRVADIFEQINQFGDAKICREAAIEAYNEAVERGIGGAAFVEARLHAMVLLHQTLTRMGRFADAEALARRLIEDRGPLAQESLIHGRKLARDYIRLGEDLAGLGRDEGAEAAFREAIDRLAQLKQAVPKDRDILEAELRAIFLYAARTKDKALSEALYRKLVARAEEGLVVSPDNVQFNRYRASGLNELIDGIYTDRPEEAMILLRRRTDQARSLVARLPDDKLFRGDLLHAAAQFYRICARMGRPGDAEAELVRAIEDGARMLAAEPAIYDRARALAFVLEAHAELLVATGRPHEALKQFGRMAEILSPWTGMQSRSPEVVPRLLNAYRQSVMILLKQGDLGGANRQIELALPLCTPEVRAKFHLQYAGLLLDAGDRSGAMAAARRAIDADPKVAPESSKFLDDLAKPMD